MGKGAATVRTGPRARLRLAQLVGAGAVATIGAWFLVHHRHDLLGAVRIAVAASPRDWMLALVASAVLIVATGGVYRECLRNAGVDVTLPRATRLALASHFFNCVMPAGKMTSVVLFTSEADRRTDAPGMGAAGFFTASVVSRVGLVVVALATLPLTASVGIAPATAVLLFAVFTALTASRLVVLALVHHRHDHLLRWEMRARTRLQRRMSGVRCDGRSTWTSCVADQWITWPKFGPAIAWSLLGKLAGGALIMVAVHTAGGSLSFVAGVTIYAVATVAGSLSFLPVGLGIVELVILHSFTSSGLTLPQAAAALIIYRVFQLWLPLLAGAGALCGLRRPAATPSETRAGIPAPVPVGGVAAAVLGPEIALSAPPLV